MNLRTRANNPIAISKALPEKNKVIPPSSATVEFDTYQKNNNNMEKCNGKNKKKIEKYSKKCVKTSQKTTGDENYTLYNEVVKLFENTSIHNRKLMRRYKKELDNISREACDRRTKRVKKVYPSLKRIEHEFHAQMFGMPKISFEKEQFKKISELSDSIIKLANSVSSSVHVNKDKNPDLFSNLAFNFGKSTALGALDGIVDLIKNFISNFEERFGKFSIHLAIIVLCVLVYKKYGYNMKLCLILETLLLACTYFLKPEIYEGFARFFQFLRDEIVSASSSFLEKVGVTENEMEMEENIKAQGADIMTISDFVVGIFTCAMFPGLSATKSNLLKYVGDLGRCVSSMEKVVEFVMRCLQKILDFVANKMGFSSYTLLSTAAPRVDKWIEDARKFVNEFNQHKFVHDNVLYDTVASLEDRVYELLSIYRNDRTSASINAMIRPLSNDISKIRNLLHQEGVGQHKLRQYPLMLSFSGTSQIGKTRMLRPFIASLLSLVLPKEKLEHVREDFDAHVYAMQPELKFWDGYHGQLVCFVDEKDLVKESMLTSENASAALIRMGNVFANVLHMAGIEQKGNVYFRSKIVVCTSNIESNFEAAKGAVSYPEAVANRFHFEIIVRVKKEFATEESVKLEQKYWRLDKNKLPPHGEFSTHVHDYFLVESYSVEGLPGEKKYRISEKLDYDELLLRCAEKYKQLSREAQQYVVDDNTAFEYGNRLKGEKSEFQTQCADVETKFNQEEMYAIFAEHRYEHSDESIRVLEDYDLACSAFVDFSGIGVEKPGAFLSKSRHELLCDDIKQGLPKTVVDKVSSEFEKIRNYDEEELPVWSALSDVQLEDFRSYVEDNPLASLFMIQRLKMLFKQRRETAAKLARYNNQLSRRLANFAPKIRRFTTCAAAKMSYYLGVDINFVQVELLLSFGTCLALVPLLGFLYKSFFSQKEEIGEEVPKKSKENFGKNLPVLTQMHDPALEDISSKVWLKNYYSICFEGDSQVIGYGFFSHMNTFNLCAHYIDLWRARGYGDTSLTLKNALGEEIVVDMEVIFSFIIVSEDWAMGTISNVRRHTDIRPLMATTKILERRPRGTIMMIRSSRNGVEKVFSEYKVAYNTTYVGLTDSKYRLPVSLQYDIPTRVGECGLPLFIVDPTTRNEKFIGFHVAGNNYFGICLIFPEKQTVELRAQGYLPATMELLGPSPFFVGTNGVTSIRQSPLHGAWGPARKKPAHLKPFINDSGEIVHPMEKAQMRYDKPILTYDQALVDVCARAAVIANTSTSAFSVRPRSVDFRTAICGIPGVEYMDSLNRSSSPGYPWSSKPRPGFKGKERFMGKNVDIDMSGPDWPALENELIETEKKLLRRERPDFFFTDSLKDELLPIEKVEIGRTRMFCPSPIVYQILFRKYFMEFIKKMMESRIQTEHAIGINVYSAEWDLLARKLSLRGSQNVFAGDFSSFDTLQSAQILKQIGEEVIQCFEDREFDELRRILWCEVWNSKHMIGRNIYVWLQSLPSGHPATTPINCLFVGTTMRMCWVRLHDMQYSSVREFPKHIVLIAYGDDNVVNVSDEKKEIFNQHTVSAAMGEFGLIYTSEDKSSNPPPLRNLTEIEFLKRKFRFESRVGRFVAPLRLETVVEMPYWAKKEGFEQIWRDNFENAMRELALHDEHTFNFWAESMLNGARRRVGYEPLVVDRNALIDEITKMFKIYGVHAFNV